MLVLTRKIDEEIQVGDEIRIKVLAIRGGSVRLGIEAPTDVKILRKELEPTPERSVPRYGAMLDGLHRVVSKRTARRVVALTE